MEELPSSESADLAVHREHPLPACGKPPVLSLDGEARHSDQASRVIAALKEDVMKELPVQKTAYFTNNEKRRGHQ
jgi:hypothetical protein